MEGILLLAATFIAATYFTRQSLVKYLEGRDSE
jgi:hypothetical protein